MKEKHKSSRRIFLEKMAAGSLGVALSAGMGAKVFAEKNADPNPEKNIHPGSGFVSDKKFVPVMLTPYKQNGKIDFEGLSRLMDFYLAAGVKGFFANCLSSEMYSISEDERIELIKHVVKYVNGRVPVVATGSFGLTIVDKAEFSKDRKSVV